MIKEIYLFNPENDMALANFTPYYKAPTEIIQMSKDLSVLPAWYAPQGSMIKLDSLSQADLLKEQCPFPELIPQVEWSDSWDNVPYRPWGWNPSLLHALQMAGISSQYLLSNEQMEKLRFLSGRQRCVEVLESFSSMNHLCGQATICNSITQVKELVSSIGECILKAPWSGSGRGLVRISPTNWTPSVEGWLARTLRVQKEIMVEPLYNKEKDFAMEFYAEGGNIHFVGYFRNRFSWQLQDKYIIIRCQNRRGFIAQHPLPCLTGYLFDFGKETFGNIGQRLPGILGCRHDDLPEPGRLQPSPLRRN